MKSKKEIIKRQIKNNHGCSVGFCQECNRKFILIDKMDDANIPVEYWTISLDEFIGPDKLKTSIQKYILDIKENYSKGKSICFNGNQGVGKTTAAICILRAAIKNGFNCYYISACDLLSEIVDFKNNRQIKNLLKNIDFLVIDELDSRFFVSDGSKELFSGIFENIFRSRSQNLLPTIICSNETNGLNNVFYGQSSKAIESLFFKYLETIYIIGHDIRKKNGNSK